MTDVTKGQIIALSQQNQSSRQISSIVRFSQTNVADFIKKKSGDGFFFSNKGVWKGPKVDSRSRQAHLTVVLTGSL